MSEHYPSNQTRCPTCKATFDRPHERWLMTENGPMTECSCPSCGYIYAVWPVAPAADTDTQDDDDRGETGQ